MNNIDKQHAWDYISRQLVYGNSDLSARELTIMAAMEEIQRLQIADDTIKKLRDIVSSDVKRVGELFTDDDIATLRILVSTAVWIRSEQLAHPNAVILAGAKMDERTGVPKFPVEVDTHNMHIHNLRHEFESGQKLYTKISAYCTDHAIKDPEWRK